MTFYQLKYYVIESFYEYIVEDGYTVAQSVGRCLDESWNQISGGGLEALTVYSTLFSKAALHAPEVLKNNRRQIDEMNRLFAAGVHLKLSKEEIEELTDDIGQVNRHMSRDEGPGRGPQ